jgi:hypothetical protein
VARKNDTKLHLRAFGVPVKLSAEQVANDGAVWIQVAREGKWEGHPSGRVVEFTRKSFEQIIANFHANPWYSPGPDGVGTQRVVPYDYEHASEMAPTEGTLPSTGAPAPAWATELQLREGEAGAELWALTLLSDQAREQIRAGGYLSTSVAVWPSAKDAATGKPIGALLTSIAFTNHPFIKGMAPIAASVSVYGKADSAEEALVGLRDLLGLPGDAAAAEVAVELETLRNAVANGMTSAAFPDGFGYLVDSVRRLLGLRVLASTDEILTTAGQLVVGVADPSTSPPTAPEDNTMTAPAAPAPALATALLGKLADLFNCRDSEPVLLAAAEKAKVKGDTLDQLLGLFESDDMTALLGDAAKTIEKAKKADEYLAGLTAVRERLGAADKKEAEVEVEQIAASMGLSGDNLARFKPLLLSARVACNVDDPKERETKLAAFYQQYPLPKVDASKALLTQTVVAGPNGVQLLGGAPLPVTPPPAAPGTPPAQPAHVQLFSAYPGRNEIEKACAYHKDKTPGFKDLPFQTQVRAASGFVRTGQLAL